MPTKKIYRRIFKLLISLLVAGGAIGGWQAYQHIQQQRHALLSIRTMARIVADLQIADVQLHEVQHTTTWKADTFYACLRYSCDQEGITPQLFAYNLKQYTQNEVAFSKLLEAAANHLRIQARLTK